MSLTVRTLQCRSSAKVNLTLDVLSRREDGYHELRSIVHSIGLWDSLRFDFSFDTPTSASRAIRHDELSLQCDEATLQGDDNLCLKAARAWLCAARDAVSANTSRGYTSSDARKNAAHYDLNRFAGARITLKKAIPHGAGLGGGSGNAAATLLAFNKAFGDLLDDARMVRLALGLGADVPFFLRGGCALMKGIGENLSALLAQNAWLLVVQPPVRLSTPRVFKAWDALGKSSANATRLLKTVLDEADDETEKNALKNPSQSHRKAAGSELARLMKLAKLLHNDLAPAAQSCGAPIAELVEILRHGGAPGACMSGSGSAVFGVYENHEKARRALDSLNSALPCHDSMIAFLAVVPLCARGVEFEVASV